jgi:hypothetical protein
MAALEVAFPWQGSDRLSCRHRSFKKRVVHVTRPIPTVEPHTAQFRIGPFASYALGQIWVGDEHAPERYCVSIARLNQRFGASGISITTTSETAGNYIEPMGPGEMFPFGDIVVEDWSHGLQFAQFTFSSPP